MTLTCTICGSPHWVGCQPGQDADATRFLQYNLFELRPAEPIDARAWCMEHWVQTFAVSAEPVAEASI